MTEEIFRADAYKKSCAAQVLQINARDGIVLNRTVFYPNGGGQPGDLGAIEAADGRRTDIATTVYDGERQIVHVPSSPSGLKPGDTVRAVVNWDVRYRRMRMHTCMHLLSVILPYPVTGGQLTETAGRLDFDIREAGLDRDALTGKLNALIGEDQPVACEWITEAELDAQPELVKTMAVKPPRGGERIRLIRIGACDLQPCGGTHVARTGEIGPVTITKIEKKGARNRRVRVAFA
ncbi:Ser-tRNA(Ala) deacylase @ Gly-tRNA(Ala) deacylase [hydrothermal vent metagenome]|uniref:Ser-tRNA(Ala) deacylase @ Gly-tRNA(Ala) deacylase n=1 Tax=hydrothermal vent metagenome TaxID=652676 RepID=A0A3B0U3Y0_9ZZZZ